MPWTSISIWLISPKLGSSTSNMAGEPTSAHGDAITRVTLCSGEISPSKEPRSVLFFVFVSDIEFKSNTFQVATKTQ